MCTHEMLTMELIRQLPSEHPCVDVPIVFIYIYSTDAALKAPISVCLTPHKFFRKRPFVHILDQKHVKC